MGTFGSYRTLRSVLAPSLLPLDDSTEVAGELQYAVEAQINGVRIFEFNSDQGLKLGEDAEVQRLCEELVVDSVESRELVVPFTDRINQLVMSELLNAER